MGKSQMPVSAEVAGQVAVMATQMREKLFGEGGVPKWGTKFSEIESLAMAAGLEMARQIMEQAAQGQADTQPPPESLVTPDGEAVLTGQTDAVLQTPAGVVSWQQPKARLSKARRDFSPSSASAGH